MIHLLAVEKDGFSSIDLLTKNSMISILLILLLKSLENRMFSILSEAIIFFSFSLAVGRCLGSVLIFYSRWFCPPSESILGLPLRSCLAGGSFLNTVPALPPPRFL